MKKFLKLAIVPATFLMVAMTVGCNKSTAEIALITDVGDIDDGSFNQSSWDAIKTFCNNEDHLLTHEYYRPFADSEFARALAIKQAVAKGAKVIIAPGFKFASSIGRAQIDYPQVKFVLLDSGTSNYELPNTCCVNYSPEYSGYIAGYAIAKDLTSYDLEHEGHLHENYNYGYCGGMGYPTVFTFAYGFIQGVVRGTLDVFNEAPTPKTQPTINFNYNYAGVFAQDDAAAARMMDWYAAGTEVVFACGGKLYQSVTEGVKDYNRKNGYYDFKEGEAPRKAARWVGVDTDQYIGLNDDHEKKTIITSALKGLGPTIDTILDFYHRDMWEMVGTKTGSEKPDEGFSTEQAALDFINDKDNNSLFTFYPNTEVVKDNNCYRILLHTSDPNISYYYNRNQVGWQLGLNSVFGNVELATERHIQLDPKDYVGIPDEQDKGDEDVLRGFYSFKKKDLTELRNEMIKGEISRYKVYGGTGADIFKKEGDDYVPAKELVSDEDGNFGYPIFMAKTGRSAKTSNDYFIEVDHEKKTYETFNEIYFDKYAAQNITMNVI